MSGRPLYTQAVERMTASSRAALARAGWQVDDVDWFVGHQANARIVAAVAEELALPGERVAVNIDKVGNTLSASIPLLLTEYAARGDLRPGDRVLLAAFGAGLSWGATTLVWPKIAADSFH
jgi:3-oxoacyl-[acyl-carrier-protein] synthase-3